MERMKLERSDSDQSYVRQMIGSLEKKLDEEQQFRARNEEDTRRYHENKLVALQEKMKQDEKMQLEREKRIMQQFQEGLSTMNEIIRGTKEQSLISLTHQQTVLGDQIKNLAITLE